MEKFFIVGCPRSGTTMVQQALNRHSQIVIPPETKVFFSFFGHGRKVQARHVERLNADLRICLPTPARSIRTLAEGRGFYNTMARRYVERLSKKDVLYFGEKTPEHTGHLRRIRQMFPHAKVLVLVRDGRDFALSLTKVPWMSPDLYANFIVWLHYQRLIRAARTNGIPHLHVVRYEDLVVAPEKELKAILRFLGLPYEPAVAEGCGNTEGIPEREYPWKMRALERISAARVGVFQHELTADQIAFLERLGHHVLGSLGYPTLTDGKKPLSLPFLLGLMNKLSQLMLKVPWHLLVNELLGFSFPAYGPNKQAAAPSCVPAFA